MINQVTRTSQITKTFKLLLPVSTAVTQFDPNICCVKITYKKSIYKSLINFNFVLVSIKLILSIGLIKISLILIDLLIHPLMQNVPKNS